jgi:phosphotransferase system  glucose/maltose/N-acetylglucosamine-specific IIC component
MQHKISIIQGFYSGKMVGFYYSDWFQIRGEQEARSRKPGARSQKSEAGSGKWEVVTP